MRSRQLCRDPTLWPVIGWTPSARSSCTIQRRSMHTPQRSGATTVRFALSEVVVGGQRARRIGTGDRRVNTTGRDVFVRIAT